MSWSGLATFDGTGVWTDGENIYYSANYSQYILSKSTSTWSEKIWYGFTTFTKHNIWTDGNNIYCSNNYV
jgi:hypothetical protein